MFTIPLIITLRTGINKTRERIKIRKRNTVTNGTAIRFEMGDASDISPKTKSEIGKVAITAESVISREESIYLTGLLLTVFKGKAVAISAIPRVAEKERRSERSIIAPGEKRKISVTENKSEVIRS